MKPIIGVPSARIYNIERPYSPYSYGVKYTYTQAVERAGGIPVMLPFIELTDVTEALFDLCDGIMFAGGNDISAQHYGDEPRDIRENDTVRDVFELELLRRAEAAKMPVLGICRGMQLMNVYRGGTLYQDVHTERPGTNNHDGYLEVESTEHLAHTLSLTPDTQLATILRMSTIKSNTNHHQAIKDLGRGLMANATAEDGVIEGIEDTSGPYFLGVQPHPETIFQRAEPEWIKLFESFMSAAQTYRTNKT